MSLLFLVPTVCIKGLCFSREGQQWWHFQLWHFPHSEHFPSPLYSGYHLLYKPYTAKKPGHSYLFIQRISPNCLAWNNASHCAARRPVPVACATASQGYNAPALFQRQLWPAISSNTEQSCLHSAPVKRGGSNHSVGLQKAFVPGFTLGTKPWGWEPSKAPIVRKGHLGYKLSVIPPPCPVLGRDGGVCSWKSRVMVLSWAVFWMQTQWVCAKMVKPVEQRADDSFSTPLAGCTAAGS